MKNILSTCSRHFLFLFKNRYATVGVLFLLFFFTVNLFGDDFDPFIIDEGDIPSTPTPPPYTFSLPKSPLKAGLLSALLPGAGQFYNEKYFKATGIVAIHAALVGMTFYYDSKVDEYRRKRNYSEGPVSDYYDYMYRDYFDKRQSYLYWVGASVFLSSMEAFVDAHLINFNEKKNEIRLKFEDQKVIVTVTF